PSHPTPAATADAGVGADVPVGPRAGGKGRGPGADRSVHGPRRRAPRADASIEAAPRRGAVCDVPPRQSVEPGAEAIPRPDTATRAAHACAVRRCVPPRRPPPQRPVMPRAFFFIGGGGAFVVTLDV